LIFDEISQLFQIQAVLPVATVAKEFPPPLLEFAYHCKQLFNLIYQISIWAV